MMNSIERLLEIKSKESGCEVLFTQWMLAKDYVPKVLSTIIRAFPHYSLHDRTHSETILNCIVRILGQDVLQSLSSVDLWLLLAASYYHDIGMAVFAEDVIESFKNEDFLFFVRECQDDETSSLHPFASLFEVQDNRLCFKNVALDGLLMMPRVFFWLSSCEGVTPSDLPTNWRVICPFIWPEIQSLNGSSGFWDIFVNHIRGVLTR